MPRKRASGSSPEKPAVTPARRNTRRGRNKSEEPEPEIPVEIPKHLLRGSDESSEESDNDSDYGSPKKGGKGRAAKTPGGRGRKAKEPAAAAPTPKPRRGRRAAAAKDQLADEADNSQETTEASESTQPEPEAEIAPQESADESVKEPEIIATTTTTTVTHDKIVVAEEQEEEEKVSEVIQEIQSNNDSAPVNEEDNGSKDNVDEAEATHCRENVVKVTESKKVVAEVEAKADSPVKVDEEESKDAPESSAAQSDSRSNSSEKEVFAQKRRQRSSSGEIQEEKMEVEVSAPVEASPEPPKEVAVEEVKPVQRKRKWTARKTDDAPVIAITTDSLKNIISEEVKPVPLSDVKLLNSSPEPEPEEKRARTKPTADDKDAKKKLLKERLRKQEEDEQRRNELLVKAIDKPANGASASNGTALLKDRKVSIIVDDPTVAATSPPKNESSNILYITNLVRPFTVLQLKGLLARTGKIVENGFWIDKIKSKCYVKYETEE
jgi:apoptotic chromatin condensation inducer in the nucleus